jgi:hypothetical protein
MKEISGLLKRLNDLMKQGVLSSFPMPFGGFVRVFCKRLLNKAGLCVCH